YLYHLFLKILFKILNNTISDMKKTTAIKQSRCVSPQCPSQGQPTALKGEDHADASVSTQGAWLLAAPALLSTQ
ncbi:hypothetical protein, partial [Vibrio sp. Vb1980]|uniref:hypothetical protein n=1 Tax=Vibrio sp. Vb1980 TaxID=3074646 RepID=UPI002964CC77